jgi:hypothetical protein
MTDTLEEYKQRHKDWRDISTKQLSLANNILITISAGYLALIFDKAELKKVYFDFDHEIEFALLFYCLTMTLIILSIIIGVAIMLNRLYDFRISRHLALTRKRIYVVYGEKIPASSTGAISLQETIAEQFKTLFIKIDFITTEDVDGYKGNKSIFESKFSALRRKSKVLGTLTHKLTKLQIALLLLSLGTYLASVLI